MGNWNRTTGALDLQILVPTFTSLVQTTILPDPVPTTFTMTQIGTGFGSLDPATGAFRLDLSVNTLLGSNDPLFAGFIGPSCLLGPTSLTLTTRTPFDLDDPVPSAVAGDAGFAFPAAHGCGDNGSMDQVLNPALALPTTATETQMALSMIQGAPGSPVDTTTTSTSMPLTAVTSSTTSTVTTGTTALPGSMTTSTTPSNPRPGSSTPAPRAGDVDAAGVASVSAGDTAPPARPVSGTPNYTG